MLLQTIDCREELHAREFYLYISKHRMGRQAKDLMSQWVNAVSCWLWRCLADRGKLRRASAIGEQYMVHGENTDFEPRLLYLLHSAL